MIKQILLSLFLFSQTALAQEKVKGYPTSLIGVKQLYKKSLKNINSNLIKKLEKQIVIAARNGLTETYLCLHSVSGYVRTVNITSVIEHFENKGFNIKYDSMECNQTYSYVLIINGWTP